MHVTRIMAAVAAAVVSVALVTGLTPRPADAAVSVSIANVAKTNAKDIKSKGIIRTPVVETPGNSAVVSRTYTIYKGKKVVAKTTSQNKAYSLARGTYTVKTTAKYRNYTDTDQYKTHTEKYISGYTERQVEHKELILAGHTETQKMGISAAGTCTVTRYSVSGTNWTVDFTCNEDNGKGRFSASLPATLTLDNGDSVTSSVYMSTYFKVGKTFGPQQYYASDTYMLMPNLVSRWAYFDATHDVWVEDSFNEWTETVYDEVWDSYTWDEWIGTKRTYGGTKTVTRTQKVTIGNSGYMTYYEYKKVKDKMKTAKVKSLVGGSGTVVDRYSYGKHEYVTRDFNGHYVYFDNGKVYAKYW